MEKNQTYITWEIVLFKDKSGFILNKSRSSHNVYVTLQFSKVAGKVCCYRGCYHGNTPDAKQDFRRRVSDYQQRNNVRITKIYGMKINRPYRH